MSDWKFGEEPTHAIPPALEQALIRAKNWHDNWWAVEGDEDATEVAAYKGADLLAEIVEAVEESWGFARPLEGSET